MTTLTWEQTAKRAEVLHKAIERDALKPERRCANYGSAPDPHGFFWCECGKQHGDDSYD